ncbi:MAG TPA: excinuclease ABC subunit UvrB [Bacillota bacterium]|nr:excinuclease ABC subunit UvrB [Bacillota bacterium]
MFYAAEVIATDFRLKSDYRMMGDQERAVEELCRGIEAGDPAQVLLGVTGSGKTFTMANIIERMNRPALVIAHNKTLAAQLCGEFREFFPENAVRYFVSYYDYYQPEAYVPSKDIYIEKESDINEEIDRMRHEATASLVERRDVIIVASVSCIYGLGMPEEYMKQTIVVKQGEAMDRDWLLRRLSSIQYTRNDLTLSRGTFRARGDVIDVVDAGGERATRIEFFGDAVDRIMEVDMLTGEVLSFREQAAIYPNSHYVTNEENLRRAIGDIGQELAERLAELNKAGKMLEAQRLAQRTRFDLEMMAEVGYCSGIENYSRHLSNRAPGEPPETLLDYFPRDFLTFIDESHVTVPQLKGMEHGDRARKLNLVEYGFRLPSAYDNRPLKFEEFRKAVGQVVFVSATPADYEKSVSTRIVEQIIRPTGLLDPEVTVRPIRGQVDDLLSEIRKCVALKQRVLVTTLTKKMAEDLTEYLTEFDVKVRYMHFDVETLERIELLRGLRLGDFDVLVGINLLREGLDLPEVGLVAILDADKEGFLRSSTSLIQTIGRAARNVGGRVVMYADRMTDSMKFAIDETNRRRAIQAAHNEKYGITPKSVVKSVRDMVGMDERREQEAASVRSMDARARAAEDPEEIASEIKALTEGMKKAAQLLEFEQAAEMRDRIKELRRRLEELGS